jgi:Tfp pilus assembly protein PilP
MITPAFRIPLVALVAALVMSPVVGAQAPAAGQPPAPKTGTPPAPKAGAPAPTPKADLPSPPANYEYTVDGRRDPFTNLVNRGADPRGPGNVPVKRLEGVPGLMTSEITVRGIVQTRGVWVAMVAGIDGKVYSVRAGDKLADGVVREVNAQSVVILQEVNDPLSLAKQREVRKLLRGGEEVK